MRAALIARVSSEGQAEEDRMSLPAQLREMRAYCEREGLAEVAVYESPGVSGFVKRLARIPQLERAVLDAEAGSFDVLIVHELSRMARNERVLQEVLDRLEDAGVGFVDCTMPGIAYTTAVGRMVLGQGANLAAFWSRQMSEHLRKATRERVARGLQSNGHLPYGYRTTATNEPAVIVEEEAIAVRQAYEDWNAGGLTLEQIADRLEASGYPPPRQYVRTAWYPRTIQTMLRNPFYVGDLRHKGKVSRGAHPPIIDRVTWELAQRPRVALSTRRKWPTLLLARVACCAACGEFCYQHNTTKHKGRSEAYSYYREPHGGYYRSDATCVDAGRTWAAGQVDAQALGVLRGLGGDPAWLRHIDREWRKLPRPMLDRRAEVEARIQRIQSEYVRGRLAEARYEQERTEAERDLAAIPESPQHIAFGLERLRDFAQVIDVATPEQANRLAKEVFRTVRLDFRERIAAFEPWPELAAIFDLRRAFCTSDLGLAPIGDYPNLRASGLYLPGELGVAA